MTGWPPNEKTPKNTKRTGATIMCDKLKVPPHVVERILTHASGTLTPLALIYNRAGYMDEMKQALDAYRAYLDTLVSLGQSST